MNRTSAGDAGGKVPFVVKGRVRVGFPGAPGWTTTGGSCSACLVSCAQSAKEEALASGQDDTSTPEHAATLITTRIPQPNLIQRGLESLKFLTIVGLTISHPEGTLHSAGAC